MYERLAEHVRQILKMSSSRMSYEDLQMSNKERAVKNSKTCSGHSDRQPQTSAGPDENSPVRQPISQESRTFRLAMWYLQLVQQATCLAGPVFESHGRGTKSFFLHMIPCKSYLTCRKFIHSRFFN